MKNAQQKYEYMKNIEKKPSIKRITEVITANR